MTEAHFLHYLFATPRLRVRKLFMEKQKASSVNVVCGRCGWPVLLLARGSGIGSRELGRCVMVAWDQGLGVKPAASTGLRRGSGFKRLPPAARDLSPAATTCHDLPRGDIFTSNDWRLMSGRKNDAMNACDSMSLADIRLGQIDRTAMRSGASDRFPENEVEALVGTVTVCQIESGGPRCEHLRGEAGNEGIEMEGETCGPELRRGPRPAPNRARKPAPNKGRRPARNRTRRPGPNGGRSPAPDRAALRVKDDKLASRARRTATLDDCRRQNFGLQREAGNQVLQERRVRVSMGDEPESYCSNSLASNVGHGFARATHVSTLIRSELRGCEAPETTTKNDNMKTATIRSPFLAMTCLPAHRCGWLLAHPLLSTFVPQSFPKQVPADSPRRTALKAGTLKVNTIHISHPQNVLCITNQSPTNAG